MTALHSSYLSQPLQAAPWQKQTERPVLFRPYQGAGELTYIMRTSYLVCYDICDEKRLRKVFKLMRGFGDHLQYSIFECQLSPSDLVRCREALRAVIHHKEDQVLFVNLGPAEGRGDRVITALGKPYVNLDSPCIVV